MTQPWISEHYLPSRQEFIAFAEDFEAEGYDFSRMPVDRPREVMNALSRNVFEELNYTSYILAYNLTGELNPEFYDRASDRAMRVIEEAQTEIAQLQESIDAARHTPGLPVRRDQVPQFMHLVFDHIQDMITEGDEAGGAADVSPEADQEHSNELGISPAAVNFFRHSGLVGRGSLADYCLAYTYVELMTKLEIALNLAMVEEVPPPPQAQLVIPARTELRDIGVSNFGGMHFR